MRVCVTAFLQVGYGAAHVQKEMSVEDYAKVRCAFPKPDEERVVLISTIDPLSPLAPNLEPLAQFIEWIEAEFPVYEAVPFGAGEYMDFDKRTQVYVREGKRGENGATIPFFAVSIVASTPQKLKSAYQSLLMGTLDVIRQFKPRR